MTGATRRDVLTATGRVAGGMAAATFLGSAGRVFAQEAVLRATHFGGPYQILSELVAKPFADAKLMGPALLAERPAMMELARKLYQ